MSSPLLQDQLKAHIYHYLEAIWGYQERGETISSSGQKGQGNRPHMYAEDRDVSDLFVDHPSIYVGGEQLSISPTQARDAVCKTFPDLHLTIIDLLAEGEHVAVRWMMQGTDLGGYKSYLPTGRSLCVTGMVMLRFENQRIVEGWVEVDIAGMLDQLGFVFAPQPPRITMRRGHKD